MPPTSFYPLSGGSIRGRISAFAQRPCTGILLGTFASWELPELPPNRLVDATSLFAIVVSWSVGNALSLPVHSTVTHAQQVSSVLSSSGDRYGLSINPVKPLDAPSVSTLFWPC